MTHLPVDGFQNHHFPAASSSEINGDFRIIARAITCTEDATMTESRASNCTSNGLNFEPISAPVRDLLSQSLSASTQRAYSADLAHFRASGYDIPSSPVEVANYIGAMAEVLKPASVSRRLASIAKAHRALGHQSPVSSEIVKATMKGLRRKCGMAQRQAKPIMTDDLHRILDALPNSPKGLRDKALLLIGFAGGFRRSEVVGIDYDHIEHVRQGIVVTLPRSKTDQEGRGRVVAIPVGRGRHCPMKALAAWLEIAGINSGPIFRPINRHGQIAVDQRLSGEAVSIVIKDVVRLVGLNPDIYSGHSLRAGLATSAAMAGVPSWKIRQQTGHASDTMLARYIRDVDLFTDNAAGRLL